MKHKLILTDEDGTVLSTWIIEEDFGDVQRPMPRQAMADAVADEVKTDNDSNPG